MNHNIYFIYGLPGSGKTTYSIELYQELITSDDPDKYKIIHLDDYFQGNINTLIDDIYNDKDHIYIIEGVDIPRIVYDGRLLYSFKCHFLILDCNLLRCILRKIKREYKEYKNIISKWVMIKDTPNMIRGYYRTYKHYIHQFNKFKKYLDNHMYTPSYIKTS